MIEGLYHISIIVSSEKTVEFYKELGFKETFRQKRSYDTVVFVEGFGLKIILFIDPRHPKRDVHPEQLGLRYFALKVENVEAMAEKYGCGPVTLDWQGEKYCMLEDPDGLMIQLHE